MAEIYQLPEGNGNGNSGIPFSIPIGLGGFGNGGFGFGNGGFNSIADLFGLAIIASMFGWGNGGFGGGFGNWGGNAGQLGFLSNQLNNDSGRELIMNAITSNGEATRTAVQSLATMLGQDFNLVNSGVQSVQNALATIAANQGLNVMQVINSIQSGNAALASQLCQCCCEQRQATMAQGYENQIRTIEQTNLLQGQNDRNTAQVRADIAAQTTMINDQFCQLKEREMQAKIDTQADIITQLRGQIDNANQTNQIIGYVNSVINPLQSKVDQIASKQLPTVNVQWPQLTAVNTTPYVSGGIYPNGYYGNNGWGGNIVF